MAMKNSNDTIGNRTRDLPTCRAVPQPTARHRVPPRQAAIIINMRSCHNYRRHLYLVMLKTGMTYSAQNNVFRMHGRPAVSLY
jgi:hypothetical protein